MVSRGFHRTLKVFFTIGGKWFVSVWVLAMLTGVVPLVLAIVGYREPSRELWIIGLFTGLVIMPIVAFHLLRIQRDEFAAKLFPREKLAELTKLRKEGVELRNSGRVFLSDSSVSAWVNEVQDWTEKTRLKLEELDSAEADLFITLDLVTGKIPAGFQPFNDLHAKHLAMLSQRTEMIKELVTRWTP